MLLIAISYAAALLVLASVETIRTKKSGPDFLFLFLGLFSLQLLIAPIMLCAVIGLEKGRIATEVVFFDRVIQDVTATESGLVLAMSMVFVVSLYAATALLRERYPLARLASTSTATFDASPARWIAVMMIGLAGMWYLLSLLGGGLAGYQSLLLFRNEDDSIPRTFVTANLFALAQTFSLLSIIGFFLDWGRWRLAGVGFSLSCAVSFGLMCGSRRAFAIQFLLALMTLMIAHRKFYFWKLIVPAAIAFVPLIMLGKEAIGYLATNPEFSLDGFVAASAGLSALLRVASDVGITVMESWATMLYLDLPVRLGADHVLSIARRFPDGLIGLDIDFPERIVRISTEAFVGPEQDIPPGFVGQMWLDYRALGPVIWGTVFAVQIHLLQRIYARSLRPTALIAVFVIVLFIVALPLNTGSFDFTLSVDIIILFALLLLICKRQPSVINA